jgi:hypothetical protein
MHDGEGRVVSVIELDVVGGVASLDGAHSCRAWRNPVTVSDREQGVTPKALLIDMA